MYQTLGKVTLRSGETVEAGVVAGPDPVWAERLVKLLWHKGDPWNWQNARLLEADQGLDAYFYMLHRDGKPLANIMTVENNGVGHFGHVWTEPAEGGQFLAHGVADGAFYGARRAGALPQHRL